MRRLLLLAALSATSVVAEAQSSPTMPAVNDRPNPYRTVEGWAKLPEGRTWGSTSAVAIDKDGKHVWVAERCGVNNCAASALAPVLKFDQSGKLVASFGAGMILSPHGIHVDKDGNIWVVDCACTLGATQASAGKGHQIHKFSPTGTHLMSLGAPGGGKDSAFFWQPNAVVTANNGDIYVAEGHSSRAGSNARVLVFDKSGKLRKSWGSFGKGEGQLDQPHALAIDSKGRLFIGDRGNDRILIVDQDFKILDTWHQFSRPSGIWIDKNDMLYVADSESGSVNPPHGAWTRGIRIGSARTGEVTAFIPDPETKPANTSSAEGVAVDASGNIFGAEVGQKALKRYEKK
ncbi:peptidyl-alpha-hydroxyglycine alpha-amidating lyase family protein [Gemmatimonas sp.]|jgi:DNA-binding beta-propeller fold protein YncE|uniref:peptidyl-alpha-hydroxyglycine alpha-amidating lyase family protein n=1 Tax=Gemmatimonas sp. TaxID=1962908 RepID=UPI003F6EF70B